MTGAGGDVVVRAGRLDEAARLDEIARAAKASWGYPPEWIETWADDLRVSPDSLAAGDVLVAEVGGACVGWTSLGTTARGPEIAHLWVAPDAQGRGVGRALLDTALREAARRGWSALRVESDSHAVGFYEAMGARVVDRVAAHLDGVERWLPVLELDTGAGDSGARRVLALAEAEDRLAEATRAVGRRGRLALGVTLVGPVYFGVGGLLHWREGWPWMAWVVLAVMTFAAVGLGLQWRAARDDLRRLGERRRDLLEGGLDP